MKMREFQATDHIVRKRQNWDTNLVLWPPNHRRLDQSCGGEGFQMAAAKPIWISSGKLGIFNARTFLDLKRYNYVFSVKKKNTMKSYLSLTNQGPHNWDPIPCTYCSVITSCKFGPCLHSCPRTPETLGIFCIFKIMRWVKDGTWDRVWMGLDSRTHHQVIRRFKLLTPIPSGNRRGDWYWV